MRELFDDKNPSSPSDPLEAARAAEGIVAGLFAAYSADPALMPGDWPERMPAEEPWRSRHIADFIAGMTDRYALDEHDRLFRLNRDRP